MQVAGFLPKKERKIKKEKEKEVLLSVEGKLKFADRLKALLTKENSVSCNDDTFNSDDPYAFPDTVSETENGCGIGFSATPILRNAWNSSQQKSSHIDISSADLLTKSEPASKTSPPLDNKLKNTVPALSKTVSRLHAKIAHNRLLDKQRKTQDASQGTIPLLNAQFTAIGCIVKDEHMSPIEDNNSIHSESNEEKVMSDVKCEVEIKLELTEDSRQTEDSVASNCVPSPNPPSVMQVDSHLSSGMNSCSSSVSERYFCEEEKCSTPSESSSKAKPHFPNAKYKDIASESGKIPIVLRKLHRIFKNKKRKEKYIVPSGRYLYIKPETLW